GWPRRWSALSRFIDLSHPIVRGMTTYPGLPAPQITTYIDREQSAARLSGGEFVRRRGREPVLTGGHRTRTGDANVALLMNLRRLAREEREDLAALLATLSPRQWDAPTLCAGWRVRGVRLAATDLDWSTGAGPEVRGTAEGLLMAIAGRRGVVSELSGPGQRKLADRIE
ncbi:MAG: hypothetical protein GEU83_20945, partial [Pseudonocardiaceae bacterium]|nr:hypothetical protein [Pseudonocardiaceae bacterium]